MSRFQDVGCWGLALAVALVAMTVVGSAVAGEQKLPPIEVTGATYFEVDETSGLWEMRGNPVVVMRGTKTLRAAVMTYDSRRQIFHASDGVTLEDDTILLTAAEVTAFSQEERILAEGGVAAVMREQSQTTRLRSDRLELWIAERRGLATGAVTLARGETIVAGDRIDYDLRRQRALVTARPRITVAQGTATADRMEVLLDREELTAEGAVRLVVDDLQASAPKMVLQQPQNVATLSGGVSVRQGRNEVTAEVVVVDLQRRRVIASGRAHVIAYPDR